MKVKRGFFLGTIVTMIVLITLFISWQVARFYHERKIFLQTEMFLQSLNNYDTTNNNS